MFELIDKWFEEIDNGNELAYGIAFFIGGLGWFLASYIMSRHTTGLPVIMAESIAFIGEILAIYHGFKYRNKNK